jgi:cytochrome b involved in lipid metabolism
MRIYSCTEIEHLRDKGRIIVSAGNNIYDVTEFIDYHPGGKNAILFNEYGDNTKSLDFHSNTAKKQWQTYKIGQYYDKCVCAIL